MHARLVEFGTLEVEGRRYDHDVVIERGKVTKRKKKPSKPYREQYGHTPLSKDEYIPWSGDKLIIGTGAYGQLPIMEEVRTEARERGVDIIALPTDEACGRLADVPAEQANAILHATC